jgi:tRNA G10  N-methylase Trm11
MGQRVLPFVLEDDSCESCRFDGCEHLDSLAPLNDPEAIIAHLNALDWSFTDDKTAYLSHDIHPYPAKFIPQIPHHVIANLSLPGELVWDPFGGCGTTALEAILLGRRALSTDINPLGEIIGVTKTTTLTKEEEEILSDFAEQLQLLSTKQLHVREELQICRADFERFIPPAPNLTEWFHSHAISELAYIRWRIQGLAALKAIAVAKVAFSKSVFKASYQDEETRYAKKPRDVAEGSIINLFASNLVSTLRKVRQLGSHLKFRRADFKTIDLRTVPLLHGPCENNANGLVSNSVDLVVTSPPYPNTTDYHLYHRFRLFWLGFDPRELARKEIGSHLRHQKEGTGFEDYLVEMSLCLGKIRSVLRPGRYAVLVVGSGVFDGKVYNSASRVCEAAKNLDFEVLGAITRPIHSTKRSFISPARRLRNESLVILRKPDCDVRISLEKAPYRLWPYEDVLRKKEITAIIGRMPQQLADGTLSLKTNALTIPQIKRLTFTHSFHAEVISKEPTWQSTLENGDAFPTSRRKDPKYVTHGLHAYKGKFYPQLAKCLFNLAGLKPGQTVLDPFCGSGTVLLESYLNGLRGIGIDINVLAIKIARVKTEILEVDPYLRDRFFSRFQDRIETLEVSEPKLAIFPQSSREELLAWFPQRVLMKLGALLEAVQTISELRVRECLEVLISSIVRDISHQDPKDLRIRRRSEPLRDAPVFELFSRRLTELRNKLLQFSERAKEAPCRFITANALIGDARSFETFKECRIANESVDAIITSPPYATALPYIDTDRLSLLLLFGLTSKRRAAIEDVLIGTREISKKKKKDLEDTIDEGRFELLKSKTARVIVSEVRRRNTNSVAGFRKQNMAALLYAYFKDMGLVLNNLNFILRPGSSAFFVIGNTKTTAGGKVIHIDSAQVLREIGRSVGWKVADSIPITVTTENRRHSKNSITENEIIWFKKP